MTMVHSYLRNEQGVAAIEYAVISSAMGVALAYVFPLAARAVEDTLSQISGAISGTGGPG